MYTQYKYFEKKNTKKHELKSAFTLVLILFSAYLNFLPLKINFKSN